MRKDKIFCIGLGKTGTTTFSACMKSLGYQHLTGPYLPGSYLALNDIHEPLLELASHFDSFDDYPWPLIYKTLHETFPDAYFFLTRRKSSAIWFESMCKHYDRYGPSESWRLIFGYNNPKPHRDAVISVYERHNDAVRAYFSRNQRFSEICWEDGSGYADICDLIGHEVPADGLSREHASDESDDYVSLDRLLKRGFFAQADWYAQNKATNPVAAKKFVHERASHDVMKILQIPSRKRRLLNFIKRRF